MNSLTNPFVVVKLKSGETIFAEFIQELDYSYVIKNPRVIKTVHVDQSRDGLMLDQWIPFTDDTVFTIPEDVVLYIGQLSEVYIKHYGSCLMREELSKINSDGVVRIRGGEVRTEVLKDLIEQIQDLGEEYSIKFGLPPSSHMINDEDLSPDRVLN